MGDDVAGMDEVVAAVDRVIRERRTSLVVDPDAPLPEGLVDELVGAAAWAPNHKRTWPWRFTLLEGGARARLGRAMATAGEAAGLDPSKVAKLPGKYLRSPAVLLVWVRSDAPRGTVRAREDRDATSAAVQNLLLAATARGVASFWATVPEPLAPAVRSVAGVDDDHDLVALVYLGRPTGSVAAPERPAPRLDRLR